MRTFPPAIDFRLRHNFINGVPARLKSIPVLFEVKLLPRLPRDEYAPDLLPVRRHDCWRVLRISEIV
jgi:hypothetical protein